MDHNNELAKYADKWVTITLLFDKASGVSQVVESEHVKIYETTYDFRNLDSERLKFLERVATYIRS
jgi:hypothetical protein